MPIWPFSLQFVASPGMRKLPLAFDLADQIQHSLYDCLYLALACDSAGTW
jgi:predicted nucleic acid-binding protein